MTLRSWLDGLGQRRRPHYGQLTLWTLLFCGLAFCGYFLSHRAPPPPGAERTGPVSVLSFLPDAVLLGDGVALACGALYLAGALLWIGGWGLPWSSWLTSLSFNAVIALYLEQAQQVTHVAHATNMLLILYALWYQFYWRDMRAARAAGRFWSTPLYPQWVHAGSVWCLGLFYGFSGLNKLLASGPGWANGLSLQLWTLLFGNPASPWTHLILSDRSVTAWMQLGTLVGETGGFVAIVSRRLRPVIGLLLIGFHVAAIDVFGWGFHANLAELALIFLPCDRWVGLVVESLEGRPGPGAGQGKEGCGLKSG